jgi:hypothetical protein
MTNWSDFLLQENGSYLLQENGSKIVLENSGILADIIETKKGSAWFVLPKMKKAMQDPGKIYLKPMIDDLRRS